ncbi:ferredoxin [Mycolicibacterium pallens]|uniref:Ferredoxin n=1 Tax=Mycolicibacterium pallens TaxID=370524 RepID=A0ABX8VD38_9MYCO|nr:ferredoxin [Mycolicibacterium pallens]APE13998.1 hypothetical protein BOH72_00890 [Mycobacterium sp. WY10]QYL15592.1 ferredoxin [Mycolicibacterium pallens]
MRARIDPTRCQGYGICVEVAPKHFTYDDWGFVQAVQIDADGEHHAAVQHALEQCPIHAIRWIDSPPTAQAKDPSTGNPVRPVG